MIPFFHWRKVHKGAGRKAVSLSANRKAVDVSAKIFPALDVVSPKQVKLSWAERFVAFNHANKLTKSWLTLFDSDLTKVPVQLESRYSSFHEASAAYSKWLAACVTHRFAKDKAGYKKWFESSQNIEDIWADVLKHALRTDLMTVPPPKPPPAPIAQAKPKGNWRNGKGRGARSKRGRK